MTFDPLDILASDGPIARRLGERYEQRPQQTQMVLAVQHALSTGGNLIVEAGTGVGKSFAYLLPAVQHILTQRAEGRSRDTGRGRVIISTHTIALQEQLISKDVPLLQAVLGAEFTALLVKGRGNYLSRRRLQRALERDQQLFDDPAAGRSLEIIERWAQTTTDGSLATLPQLERPGVWDHARSDSDDCLGRRCASYQTCFYQSARRRMENADLLVVNHALFFADLALRMEGFGLLPPYDAVILDEAHTVEDVASEYFGLSASRFQVRLLLQSLLSRNGRGLLNSLQNKLRGDYRGFNRAMDLITRAAAAQDQYFDELVAWQEQVGRSNGRVDQPHIVENPLSPLLNELSLALKVVRDGLPSEEDRMEVDAYANRCQAVAGAVTALQEQSETDSVYWLEINTKRQPASVRHKSAPIDVGPLLGRWLFDAKTTEGAPIAVVLTSATLATSGKQDDGKAGAEKAKTKRRRQAPPDGADAQVAVEGQQGDAAPIPIPADSPFAHLRTRLGLRVTQELLLGSPFDYARQAQLLIEAGLPEPNQSAYLGALGPVLLEHLDRSDGGAFVLFTSYDHLRQVAQWLRPRLEFRGMPLLVHGDGEQRSVLLDRFRGDRRSVLLGADSFWQGVDVQGEGLRNVIITRLPFTPPDHPLTEARTDRIKARGGNAFRDYSLPEAILKFKQGFGRLIRSRTDQGSVVVLDSRLAKKPYGKRFLAALPALPVQVIQSRREESWRARE